jgi:sirohydrochlorin ferrochelatase
VAAGKSAILLVGHGSRVPAANRVLHGIARSLRARFRGRLVAPCYLEAARPGIQEAIDRCVARGARRILCVPYFLYLGGHVERDLPAEMARARARHPGLRIRLAAHLGHDARLVSIVADRIRSGLVRNGWV